MARTGRIIHVRAVELCSRHSFLNARPQALLERHHVGTTLRRIGTHRLAQADDAGDILRAGANVTLLSATEYDRRHAVPLAQDQSAHALAGVDLVTGESVALHAGLAEMEGHPQEALHAVHVDGSLGAMLITQLTHSLDRLHRADLVVHLHEGDQEHVLPQHGFQLLQVAHAPLVHGNVLHLVTHALNLLGAVEDGGMLHAEEQHTAGLLHRAQVPQDGDVVRLGAAGGEHQRVAHRARSLQAGLPGGGHQLFRLHGGLVEGAGVMPLLRQNPEHSRHHRIRRTGGGAIIQIYVSVGHGNQFS